MEENVSISESFLDRDRGAELADWMENEESGLGAWLSGEKNEEVKALGNFIKIVDSYQSDHEHARRKVFEGDFENSQGMEVMKQDDPRSTHTRDCIVASMLLYKEG